MNKFQGGKFLEKASHMKIEKTPIVNTPLFRKGEILEKKEDSDSSDIFSDVSSIKEEKKVNKTNKFSTNIKRENNENILQKIKEYNQNFTKNEEIQLLEKESIDVINEDKKEKKKNIELEKKEKDLLEYSLRYHDDLNEEAKKILEKPLYVKTEKKKSLNENKKIKKLKEENELFSVDAKRLDLINEGSDSDKELPDDNDNLEKEIEYQKWKLREIQRLKRDKLIKEKYRLEEEDKIRRSNMSDKERMMEDRSFGKYDKNFTSDYKYMQKYYSSFSFFQDSEDPVYKRDYNIPVGFDTFDKSNLPKRLQVRGGDFGKKGKSKYKDLVTEDTNNYDPNYQIDSSLWEKYSKKKGGVNK